MDLRGVVQEKTCQLAITMPARILEEVQPRDEVDELDDNNKSCGSGATDAPVHSEAAASGLADPASISPA